MTVTPKMIAEMRHYWNIDKNLETLLFKRFGTEPFPHTYTEQDLYEQVRKIVIQYNGNGAEGPLNSPDPGVSRSNNSTNNLGGHNVQKTSHQEVRIHDGKTREFPTVFSGTLSR